MGHTFQIDYTFQVVLLGTAILGALSGLIGSFLVLRREALIGDGIAHSSYAGIVLAFLVLNVKQLEGLLLGAFLSALVALGVIMLAKRHGKLPFDGVIATVLSSFFGLGMVLFSIAQKAGNANQSGLNHFIYGQASTILYRDVVLTSIIGAILVAIVLACWKEFKLISFDANYARALGLPVQFLTALLGFVVIATVLLAIQAVGIILMSAMLIAPAVAAFHWTRRLETMVVLSAFIGAISSMIGTIISSAIPHMPTGPSIVVVLSIIVLVSLLISPYERKVKI